MLIPKRNLSELAAPLRMTFPAATKHVRVLEGAKLVRRRVAGREHLCRLDAAPLKEAIASGMDQGMGACNKQMDALLV